MAYRLKIAVLTFLLFSASSAYSQVTFTMGLKGGVSTSVPNVYYTYPRSGDVKRNSFNSFARGITFHYKFFDGLLSFQPELLWVKKGVEEVTTSEVDEFTTITTETITYDYIQIPYLLKLNYDVAMNKQFNIFGGFYKAVMIHGESRVQNKEDDRTTNIHYNRGFDIGLTIGGGLDYHTSIGTLTIDARAEIGLLNIYEGQGTSLPVFRNRAYLLMMGYEL